MFKSRASKLVPSTVGMLCLALGGCTTLPRLPDAPSFDINFVIQNIRCELLEASYKVRFVAAGRGWTAGPTLTVKVENSGTGTANAGLTIPLTPSIAAPSLVVSTSGTATRTVVFGFVQNLKFPPRVDCNKLRDEKGRYLSSELGVAEWLAQIQTVIAEQSVLDKTFQPTAVSTIIDFKIKQSGTAGLAFTLVPIGSNQLGAGATLQASREALHSVSIVLSKNPEAKVRPEPIEVIIVPGKPKKATVSSTRRTPSVSKTDKDANDNAILLESLRQLQRSIIDNQ